MSPKRKWHTCTILSVKIRTVKNYIKNTKSLYINVHFGIIAQVAVEVVVKYSINVRLEKIYSRELEYPASPGVHSNRTSTPLAPFLSALRVVPGIDSLRAVAATRHDSARVDRWNAGVECFENFKF